MTTLPATIAPVGGRAAWRVPTLPASAWLYELTGEERSEIAAATASVVDAGARPEQISRDAFPLPRLSARLDQIGTGIQSGVGFAVVRGVPVDYDDDLALETLNYGLGCWLAHKLIGDPGSVNPYTTHLRDVGKQQTVGGRIARGPHTDVTDWLTLLCHRSALAGGASGISSLTTVHDVMAEREPDALQIAYQPFDFGSCYACHRRLLLPGFARTEERLFGRAISLGRDGAPATDSQRRVSALMTAIAEEPEVQLRLILRPGDLLIVDNTQVLHARTEFLDADPPKRRHLLRLHLEPRVPLPKPPAFDWRCGDEWHDWSIPAVPGGTAAVRPTWEFDPPTA